MDLTQVQKYAHTAHQLAKKSLSILTRLLVFVGKPFFTLLTYIILTSLTLSELTPHYFSKAKRQFTKTKKHIYKNLPRYSAGKLTVVKNIKVFTLQTLTHTITNLKANTNWLIKQLRKTIASLPSNTLYTKRQSLLAILTTKKTVNLKKLLTRFQLIWIKITNKKVFFYIDLKGLFIVKNKVNKFLVTSLKKSRLFLLKSQLFYQNSHKSTQAKRVTRPSVRLKLLKVLAIFFEIAFLAISLSILIFWYFILKDLPSPYILANRKIDVSTKIYDRNGLLLYKIYKDQNRTPVSLSDIPKHVRLATLAIEDAEFYTHPGFSIRGIVRAFKRNVERGEITGGSTITQQLVKNAILSSEKTIIRKLKEVSLAIKVETTYSKDQILEMYLNEVSYGGTAYGIQEAAKLYFDKDVKDLSLGEAALLAGLPKSPTQFSPFGTHPEKAFDRQKEVLHLMQVNGYINSAQQKMAESESVVFTTNQTDIKAPHFVMYVRALLEEKYGKEVVESGGLEITTTLDYNLQQIAETVVKEEVEKLTNLNVGNGAAVVLDPKTGEILAMVGSKDYFDTENDGNVNVVTALNSPGSSIKVVNYAYALANNYTLATTISDSPVTFNVPGLPPYTPKNYEGGFRGNLTLRSAFAESRNVPAVKVLASYGVGKMLETGRNMGISTWTNPSDYGLSLTLGGGEVTLLDLARVYSTVANYGKRQDLTAIIQVTNYKGKILEENKCITQKGESVVLDSNFSGDVQASESALNLNFGGRNCEGVQVLDPRVAYLLIDILKDNSARSPAFGSSSYLVVANHPEVAVKTGTSNDLRDNLTVGFDQNYVVAVWVGNNDNSEMSRVASGVTGASPIFNKIITTILANKDHTDWQIPSGLVQLPVCTLTGTLGCDGCSNKVEWFLDEKKPTNHCNPEVIRKIREDKAQKKINPEGEVFETAASTGF